MSVKLEVVRSKDNTNLDKIYQRYTETFPPEERRNQPQFYALLNNPNVTIYEILSQSENVGYIVIWTLPQAIFIEHFEVYPKYRGNKIGEEVIKILINNHSLVILETEPNSYGEIAKKRIEFYKRNGFKIIDENYIQPAYEPDKEALSLYLMGSKKVDDLEDLKKSLYIIVYHK